MLPIVLSMGTGQVTDLKFDPKQRSELLLTISQSTAALMLLVNMSFVWWEALLMLVLFALQFVLPYTVGPQGTIAIISAFLLWTVAEVARLVFQSRTPAALVAFRHVWAKHLST